MLDEKDVETIRKIARNEIYTYTTKLMLQLQDTLKEAFRMQVEKIRSELEYGRRKNV